jgi:hypothetical protein
MAVENHVGMVMEVLASYLKVRFPGFSHVDEA